MTRLRAILFALRLAAPHWSPAVETARELERLEARYRVDAMLIIADAEHESRWQERAVNSTSGALGLLQVMPYAGHPYLLDWRENLHAGVAVFALARSFCRARGYTQARDWLWLPTGWDAVSGSRCGHRNGRRLPTPRGIRWLLARAAVLRACPSSTGKPAASLPKTR